MGTCIYGRQITRMVYALKRFLWVTRAIGGRRKGWRVICGKFFPQTLGGLYRSGDLLEIGGKQGNISFCAPPTAAQEMRKLGHSPKPQVKGCRP